MKKNKILSLAVVLTMLVTVFSSNVLALDAEVGLNDVEAIQEIYLPVEAAAAANELTSGYDQWFKDFYNGSTFKGYAQKGYEVGGLFNLYQSRTWTEIWSGIGNSGTPYTYASISNSNSGSSKTASSDKWGFNSICSAYAQWLSDRYATSTGHTATW